MGRQTRRGLSQYEMAAQEQIRERNAEQAGQIPEPDLPSTGTSRISALLADAQRQREEAWRAQAERQREETLRAEAQRQAEEALVAEARRQAEEVLPSEARRQREGTPPDRTAGRGGGSRWSEIVLERRMDLGENPFRPASHDPDLPYAG